MNTTRASRFLNGAFIEFTLAAALATGCGPKPGLDPGPEQSSEQANEPAGPDAVSIPDRVTADACPIRTNPAEEASGAELPPFCVAAASASSPVVAPNADRVLLIVDAAPLSVERKRWRFLQNQVRAHSDVVPSGPLDNKFIANMTSVQCAVSFPKDPTEAQNKTTKVLKGIADEPDAEICAKSGKQSETRQRKGCIVDLLSACEGADLGHTNISSALKAAVDSKNYDMILLAFDGVEDYLSSGTDGETTGFRWPAEIGKFFAEDSLWSVHIVGVPALHRQLYVITRKEYVVYARSVIGPLQTWLGHGEVGPGKLFAAELWPGSWHDPGVRLGALNASVLLDKSDPLLTVSCASNGLEGHCPKEESSFSASGMAVGIRVSTAKWVGSSTKANVNWELAWAPQSLSGDTTATFALPPGLVRRANQGSLVSSTAFQAVASTIPQWTSRGPKVEAPPGLDSCNVTALWDESDPAAPRHTSLFQVAGVDVAAGKLRGVIAKADHESDIEGLIPSFAKHLDWINGWQIRKAQGNDAETLANAAMANKNLGLSAFAVLSEPPVLSKCFANLKNLLAQGDDARVLAGLSSLADNCSDDRLLATVTRAIADAPEEKHPEGKGNAGAAMSDKRQGDITLLRVIVKAADAAIARLGSSKQGNGQCTAIALRWLGR